MKNIKIFMLMLMIGFVSSCVDKTGDDLVTGEATTGGLIEAQQPLTVHIKGSGQTYTLTGLVNQGTNKTTSVEIFKSFTSEGVTSESVKMTSVNVENTSTNSYISFDVNYANLREGLTFQGAPLPEDDGDLKVGDFFTLSYWGISADGTRVLNNSISKVAVSGRLAGVYAITSGTYTHPTAGSSSFSGAYFRIIESINEEFYRMSDIGPWENEASNFFYFSADEDNGTVMIPKEYDGSTQVLWGADELATCQDNPNELAGTSCTNTVEIKTDGKDVISLSYGYIRASGTRQFDEVLTKQ